VLLLPLILKLFGYNVRTGEKNGFDGRHNFGRKIKCHFKVLNERHKTCSEILNLKRVCRNVLTANCGMLSWRAVVLTFNVAHGRSGGFEPLSKGRPAKKFYTKSESLTLSFTVTWYWSERVNLYNRQIIIIPRNTKTYAI